MHPANIALLKAFDLAYRDQGKRTARLVDINLAEEAYIYDSPDVGHTIYVDPAQANPSVMVRILDHAPTEKVLLPYDGHFTSTHSHAKCDAILFTPETFCYIESKLNADSAANPKTIEDNRTKGIKQLEQTICIIRQRFDAAALPPNPRPDTRAYLATPSGYPASTAQIQNAQVRFIDRYNILLQESPAVSL